LALETAKIDFEPSKSHPKHLKTFPKTTVFFLKIHPETRKNAQNRPSTKTGVFRCPGSYQYFYRLKSDRQMPISALF
jgi:hypothetical protein